MKKLFIILFLFLAFSSAVWAADNPLPDPNTGMNKAASGSWFVQPTERWQETVFGQAGGDVGTEMNAERYAVFTMTNMAQTIITAISGQKTVVAQGPNGPVYGYQGGGINILAGLTSSLYTNPPASSVEYIADLGNTLGIVKPVYAQGMGFNNLSPLLTLWKVFRNLAYLFFVIIFVVVGLMVMFRKKIDPRTVVTIQEALPHLVLALILITFSYAIIGLFVDVINLSSIIIMQIFYPNDVLGPGLGVINNFLYTNNIMSLIWGFSGPVDSLGKIVEINLNAGGFGLLAGLSTQIVFNVGLFYLMFKVFFMLLGSYVGIVLAVIMSPFQILLKTLPGEKNNLLSFLSDLLANVLIFPVTLTMLLIAFKFIHDGVIKPGQFKPPWDTMSSGDIMGSGSILSWAPPLMGFTQGLGIFIGYGILMAIPAVGNTIKEALEVKGSAMAGEAEKGIRGGLGWVPFIGGLAR